MQANKTQTENYATRWPTKKTQNCCDSCIPWWPSGLAAVSWIIYLRTA